MSRCFPFPPPGYERKHRPEDLNLLKEAKLKDRKHKKEKKDKERKKDKEKDGSDEKQREKKDRKAKLKDKKEKHREKNDKEDRGKDKDQSSISEESTLAGKFEDTSGRKLQPKVHCKDSGISLNEGNPSALFQEQNRGKLSQSNLPSQANEELKFVQELNRRIRDGVKSTGSQLSEKVAVLDKKDQEMVVRAAVRKSSGQLVEEKSYNNNKRTERKIDHQRLRNEFSGNTLVHNLMPMAKSKVEGIPKPVDEENGRRLEEREKYKETVEIERGNLNKDRDKESLAKEKDKEKVKKKDDKVKIKTENKNSTQTQLKDDGRNDLVGFTGNKSSNLLKNTNSNAVNEENIKKRKDMCANGFLHDSELRPNKMQRPVPHQLTENGRKLEPFQTPTKPPHDKHAVPSNVPVDSKDGLKNGIIEAQKPSPSKPKSSAANVVGDQTEALKTPHHHSNYVNKAVKVLKIEDLIAEASRRPPHPDSTYLAKVLTVPKLEDWSENDDQGWLVSKRRGPSNKRNVESLGIKDNQLVWSEAVHIESADVYALPYVIPY